MLLFQQFQWKEGAEEVDDHHDEEVEEEEALAGIHQDEVLEVHLVDEVSVVGNRNQAAEEIGVVVNKFSIS